MVDFSFIISELAKASPYALLLVLGFALFYHMHKNSIAEIKDFSEKTIREIRNAYKEAYKQKI